MTVVVTVVLAVVLVASLVTWQASRVDRLVGRVAVTAAALDAALVRRAVAAEDLARRALAPQRGSGAGPSATTAQAARDVLAAGARARVSPDAERTTREDRLSSAVSALRGTTSPTAGGAQALQATSRTASLARRLHAEAVSDLDRRLRAPLPRLLHLRARSRPPELVVDADALVAGEDHAPAYAGVPGAGEASSLPRPAAKEGP